MIISTTLSSSRPGPAMLADALRTVVDHVDLCLIVDMGMSEEILAAARSVVGAKLRTVPVGSTLTGDMRNQALAEARNLGGTWAVTLDTDERIVLPPTFSERLPQVRSDVLLAKHVSGEYSKERVFRLPAAGRWVGDVHEYFQHFAGCVVGLLANVTFDELPKSPERLRTDAHTYIGRLRACEREDPDYDRWPYYLGATLATLGLDDEAAEAWERAVRCRRGSRETRAWAAYRLAVYHANADDTPTEALAWCGRALALWPHMPEVAVLASQLDEAEAEQWMVIARAAAASAKPRIGFCDTERVAMART